LKFRNKRPGPVVIADARLALAPGEVVEVTRVTPQTRAALERGLAEEVPDQTPVGAPEPRRPMVDLPAEYQSLSAADAIEQIGDETDPKKLEALLGAEKRKTVLDALNRRLEEVKTGGTG